MKLFSYVVEHDEGGSPNPYHKYCTLAHCKYRENLSKPKNLIEKAVDYFNQKEEVWVLGTGGANLSKSEGHGKIIYLMKVTDVLSLEDYYLSKKFALKKYIENGNKIERLGDNYCLNDKDAPFGYDRYVLISNHFVYFGRNAKNIPSKYSNSHLEKKGPSYRYDFNDDLIQKFTTCIIKMYGKGKKGDPCMINKQTNNNCKPCKPKKKSC